MVKIAVVTDDHETISAHFGRAGFYEVFTLQDGKVTARESRQKPSHNQFMQVGQATHGHENGHVHGHGPEAEGRHGQMAEVIQDCQVLIGRGMGMGAYDSLKRNGIQPILTELVLIDEAVQAYGTGQLVDRPERLH